MKAKCELELERNSLLPPDPITLNNKHVEHVQELVEADKMIFNWAASSEGNEAGNESNCLPYAKTIVIATHGLSSKRTVNHEQSK